MNCICDPVHLVPLRCNFNASSQMGYLTGLNKHRYNIEWFSVLDVRIIPEHTLTRTVSSNIGP